MCYGIFLKETVVETLNDISFLFEYYIYVYIRYVYIYKTELKLAVKSWILDLLSKFLERNTLRTDDSAKLETCTFLHIAENSRTF